MKRLVCHLIDANLDTAYFRAIAWYHDKALDREELLSELGDVLFYLTALAHEHEFTLAEAEKLLAGLPDVIEQAREQDRIRRHYEKVALRRQLATLEELL